MFVFFRTRTSLSPCESHAFSVGCSGLEEETWQGIVECIVLLLAWIVVQGLFHF
jgi:hypothetical protein